MSAGISDIKNIKHTLTHDQNFKNLILDYPRESLEFFAAEECGEMGSDVRITPVRQEQLKDRLGDSFHELDTPLLTEGCSVCPRRRERAGQILCPQDSPLLPPSFGDVQNRQGSAGGDISASRDLSAFAHSGRRS